MPRVDYGLAEHRQAYEVWKRTRSLARVQEETGLAYQTISRWKSVHFNCTDGCPYHGWEELALKESKGAAGEIVLASTLADSLEVPEKKPRRKMSKLEELGQKIVRSDIDKLADWEYLYAKVYYDMTGMVLDCQHLQMLREGGIDSEELEEIYARGKRAVNMEGAIRCLQTISDEIRKLKVDAGITKKKDYDPKDDGDTGELTYEQAKQAMELLDEAESRMANTDPAKLEAIRDLLSPNIGNTTQDSKTASTDQ